MVSVHAGRGFAPSRRRSARTRCPFVLRPTPKDSRRLSSPAGVLPRSGVGRPVKLNNKQKIQVEQWQSKLCLASRIIQVIDRTCGYRDVLLKWEKSLNQPNNQIAIVNYITRLELTRSGGLRVEETEQESIDLILGSLDNEIVPLIDDIPPLPQKKVNKSLYPKDKQKTKLTKKKVKPKQLSLPLSETEQKLLKISLDKGGSVQSREELLSGKEGWYSLEQNRTVFLPAPILILLKDFECSLNECETVAMLAGVLSPQDLLFWVEQIPAMRENPAFVKFQEPVSAKIEFSQKSFATEKAKVRLQ